MTQISGESIDSKSHSYPIVIFLG